MESLGHKSEEEEEEEEATSATVCGVLPGRPLGPGGLSIKRDQLSQLPALVSKWPPTAHRSVWNHEPVKCGRVRGTVRQKGGPLGLHFEKDASQATRPLSPRAGLRTVGTAPEPAAPQPAGSSCFGSQPFGESAHPRKPSKKLGRRRVAWRRPVNVFKSG